MKIVDVSFKPESKDCKLFFGRYGNFIRTDTVTHPQARNLKEFSEGNTWYPREIDYTNDRFEDLSPTAKRMFKLNIAYQTLMDSGVSNGYESVITRIVTDPSWYLVFKRIGTEEAIHAESYSYALNELFGTEEAEKILDQVYHDPKIQSRMQNEVMDFSDVYYLCIDRWEIDSEAKMAILRMIVRTYILEAVKFPFSFFVTFAINIAHQSAIQGVTRLIKLIAHDELFFHVPVGRNIIRILKTDENQGFKYLFDNGWFETMVKDLTLESVASEIYWSKYLLQEGDISGFNSQIAEHFIRFHAYQATKVIGVEIQELKEEKSDIIDLFNTYKDLNLQNTAMQEAENGAYQKGVLKNDFPEGVWPESFDLLSSSDNL